MENPNREKILAAASRLFLSGGVAALSVRAIAKVAGLSTMGIYSHFDGKQGILDALYIEGFERVAQAMERSMLDQSLKSPRSIILRASEAYMEVASQYGAHYRLIFGESTDSYKPSTEARESAELAFSKLVDMAGLVLPADADIHDKRKTAVSIWSIVHGHVSLSNHAVSQLPELNDWQTLALQNVDRHLQTLNLK